MRHGTWATAAAAMLSLALLVSCTNKPADRVPSSMSEAQKQPALSLIPYPAHLSRLPGAFEFGEATPVIFDPNDGQAGLTAGLFIDLVQRSHGPRLVSQPHGEHAITLRRLADPNATGKEGYRLEVTPASVTISASQTAGLLYGTMTLWQLMTQSARQFAPRDYSGP